MPVVSESHELSTKGFNDCHDITADVQAAVTTSKITQGLVTIFVPGSTAGITTIEYEPGVVSDLADLLNRVIPQDHPYKHNRAWDDDNGFSHLRASLIGPSLTIPITQGTLQLGQWQQIVFLDFDNRPRRRTYTVTMIGE